MSFSANSQCQIPYCYTYRLLYAGATQGELPEGQERVPWGYPCRATRWLGYSARQLRIALVVPQGAPTSAHRLYPVCTNYPAWANIVRPRNGKPSRPCANEACAMTAAFSILHSQFPISGKIKRTLTRPFYLLRAPSTENPSVSDAADLRRTPSARSALRYCRRP